MAAVVEEALKQTQALQTMLLAQVGLEVAAQVVKIPQELPELQILAVGAVEVEQLMPQAVLEARVS